jgi:hypothetical protein
MFSFLTLPQDARPKFQVMFTVFKSLKPDDAKWLSSRAMQIPSTKKGQRELYTDNFDLIIPPLDIDTIDAVFPVPEIAELLGTGFEKRKQSPYYELRFPRFKKLPTDRDWKAGVSLEELQEAAEKALRVGSEEEAEQCKNELAIVDRLHLASGTSVPSEAVGEKVRLERCHNIKLRASTKVLNIDATLTKGPSLRKRVLQASASTVEKENATPEKKRQVLDRNSPLSPRTPLNTLKSQGLENFPSTPEVSDYHLKLGVARKTTWDRYFGSSGVTSLYVDDDDFCDVSKLLDTVKSHCKLTHTGQVDICVEGSGTLIRNIYSAAKMASQSCPGKWSVYFPRAIKPYDYQCSESHRQFTYIGGQSHR